MAQLLGRKSRASAVPLIGLFAVVLSGSSLATGQPGQIAFEDDRDGGWGLSAMRPEGTGVIRLPAPSGAADASWSPNGKQVAFEANPNGDGNLEMFVIDVNGANLRQLTDSEGRDFWSDWFPNGREIAFTSDRTGVPNIYVMNADGSDQRALTTDTEFANAEPDVSPDGKDVVFMRASQFEPPTIWAIGTDGQNLRQLTLPGAHEDIDPQWSPNGKRIVFSSNRGGTYEIYVMDADGGNVVQLTTSAGADFNPTFSPNGQQIAWWKFRGGQGDIWTMNSDGSGQLNVTATPAVFEGFPDWHQGHLGKQ